MKWRDAKIEKPSEDQGLDLIVIIPEFSEEMSLWSGQHVHDFKIEIVTLWWGYNKKSKKRECLFEAVKVGYGQWRLPDDEEDPYPPFYYWMPLDEFEWPISPYINRGDKE